MNSKITFSGLPKNKLILLNEILRFAEIGMLSIFFLYFIFTLLRIDPICITSKCASSFLAFSLLDFVVVAILPCFVLFSVLRVIISFTINNHDKTIEISFYLGLLGIFLTYLIFALRYGDFFYIYAKNSDIQTEPVVVTFELFIFLFSGLLLLLKKRNWDNSVFFVKLRLIFFILHLVLLTININFGVIAFIVSIPSLVWADLKINNHYHRETLERHI